MRLLPRLEMPIEMGTEALHFALGKNFAELWSHVWGYTIKNLSGCSVPCRSNFTV